MEVLSNLLFNGTSGTTDQVLTSNGTSLQLWESPAAGSSKWTNVGTGRIYRNSWVTVNSTVEPTSALDVYGTLSLNGASFALDGTGLRAIRGTGGVHDFIGMGESNASDPYQTTFSNETHKFLSYNSSLQAIFTASTAEFAGTLKVGTLANDNTENNLVVWNATDKIFEYRTVASLPASGITASSTDTLTNKSIALGSNTVTGTKAQFNTAVTDGDFLYVGDIVGVTDGDKGEVIITSGVWAIDRTISPTWSAAHIFMSDVTIQGDLFPSRIVTNSLDIINNSSAGGFRLNTANTLGYKAILGVSNLNTADRTIQMPDANGTLVLKVNNTAPDASGNVTISASGGLTRAYNSTSTNYTVLSTGTATDYYVFASGTITVTLSSAASNTDKVVIKNTGSDIVTIATVSSQTIDGSTSITIPPLDSVTLISNGTNWFII